MAVQPRVILIAGPTASGKSALALRLAKRLGGVVVNADSMQVYRDLRILTSRPGPEEEARVRHLLYGHVDAADTYSVGRFLLDAAGVLNENPSVPKIFVGGTGLYLEALIHGLSTAPHIPDPIRSHWREQSRTEPVEALHAELERRDPVMAARLRPSDPQRILRALEVVDATGVSLAQWQETAGTPLVDATAADKIVLRPDRTELRERISRRFRQMMEQGALEEVRALLARNLPDTLPAMRAIGVGPLASHLRGEAVLEQAIGRAITDTHQYAKRQDTWFRNRFSGWLSATAATVEGIA